MFGRALEGEESSEVFLVVLVEEGCCLLLTFGSCFGVCFLGRVMAGEGSPYCYLDSASHHR